MVYSGQGELPQYLRIDPWFGGDNAPIKLGKLRILVKTTFGTFGVEIQIGGHGIPLVFVNGYTSSSAMYENAVGRFAYGFKMILVNIAGHGGSESLPRGHSDAESQAELLTCTLDALGIKRCILAGHSLGGLLAAIVTSNHPDRVIELILLNSITGENWDLRIAKIRPLINDVGQGRWLARVRAEVLLPPLVAPLIASLAVDSVVMAFNAARIGRSPVLLLRGAMIYGAAARLIPPGLSILAAAPSVPILEKIARTNVPVVVVYGENDPMISLADAKSTMALTGGRLIVVHQTPHAGSGHSWLLEHPATLPAILDEALRRGPLGIILRDEVIAAGLNPHIATQRMLEEACAYFYEVNAPALTFTPLMRFGKPPSESAPVVPWSHYAAA